MDEASDWPPRFGSNCSLVCVGRSGLGRTPSLAECDQKEASDAWHAGECEE